VATGSNFFDTFWRSAETILHTDDSLCSDLRGKQASGVGLGSKVS